MDAYADLQNAIAVATSNDEIWVAGADGDGLVYVPTTGTSRAATFQLPNGVEIYGGFRGLSGDEGTMDETTRPTDPNTGLPTLLSILSGEIGAAGTSDNCYHVVTAMSVDADTFLDGMTIRDGFGAVSGATTTRGAGIYVSGTNSSPTISNCTITNNQEVASTGSFGFGGAIA